MDLAVGCWGNHSLKFRVMRDMQFVDEQKRQHD